MTTKKPYLILAALSLFAAGSLHAAVYTWDANVVTGGVQDGAGGWSTSGSNTWYNGTNNAWVDGNDVVLGASGTGATITLGSAITANSITFGPSKTTAYTVAGNTLTLTSGTIILTASSTNATSATNNPTISSIIAGSNGLTVVGPGTALDANLGTSHGYLLLLGGNNTYSGTTTITNGAAIRVTSAGASSNITNNAGGGLVINNGSLQSNLAANTGFNFANGLGTGTGQISLSGSIADFSGRSNTSMFVVIGAANSVLTWGSTYFSPTVLGFNTADLLGGTALVVTSSNGYDLNGTTRTIEVGNSSSGTGMTGIITGGIINSTGTAGLTFVAGPSGTNLRLLELTGTNTYNGVTTINNSSSTLQLGGNTAGGTTGGSINNSSGIVFNGATGVDTLQVNLSVSSTLSSITTTGAAVGALVQMGSGTTSLIGTNIYSGTTTINRGALMIGDGATNGTLASSSLVTGSAGATLIFNRSDAVVVSNTISGALGLTQQGSGQVTLSSSSNYTGVTTITSGTLQLGNGVTDGLINSSGTISNSGALVYNTVGTQIYAGSIQGGGSVTKMGGGNQTLSGSSSYTGATIVNNGNLVINNLNGLGSTSSITVGSTGSLNLSGANVASTRTLTLSGGITLNSGAALTFGIGVGSVDQLVLGAAASVNGTITINVHALAGASANSLTLISDASGGLSAATFVLGTLPALTSGSLTLTDTTLSLTFSGVTVVYWKGGTSSVWTDGNGANWATAADGSGTLGGTMFGQSQSVVFSAAGAASATSTTLGGDVSASSLTINDPNGVTIGGNNTLTLYGANGILVTSSAAGTNTVSANLAWNSAATSNVEVDAGSSLTVGGTMSGSVGLTKLGNGVLTLSNTNTYTGGTVLNAGTIQVNNPNSLGDASGALTFNGGTLQLLGSFASSRNYVFSSGTGTLNTQGNVLTSSGLISGGGGLNLTGGGQWIVTGSAGQYHGLATISSGTWTFLNPASLAQSGTNTINVAAGATLELNAATTFQNIGPAAGSALVLTGSGTILKTGTGTLFTHTNTGSVIFSGTGGVIEIATGLYENGGNAASGVGSGSTAGGANWTNNKDSLQIDSGASFCPWDTTNPIVDSLLGSGTLTRLGFSNGQLSPITIGVNNGSGTFSGVITNLYGFNTITKTGTGTQVFSGNNSYSGATNITGSNGLGTLRITSNNGLGFGGRVFAAAVGTNTSANNVTLGVTVSGTGTLDLSGVTVNKQIVLNTGNLINSSTSTTTVIDNGIAALNITGTAGGTYATPVVSFVSNDAGTGVSGTAGSAAAPGGTTFYAALTTPGSGYTVAPTVTIADTTGTGSGLSATAILSSVTVTGTANNVGGDGNLTINAVVSGAGGFTKVGNGTLTLGATNTYAGDTGIGKGKVVVAGSISGNVNVGVNTALVVNGSVGGNVAAAAGAVSGIGTIGGNVSLASTGSIQGGTPASTGTLTVGSLDLSAGGTVQFTIDSATTLNSLLVVNNTISLSNNLANLVGVDLYGGVPDAGMQANLLAKGSFTILKLANPVTDGTFAGYTEGSTITVGFNEFTISYAGGDFGTDVVLTYVQTVPEPQTWAMFLGGTGMLVGFLRSRRFRR